MIPTIIGVSILALIVGGIVAKMIINKKNGKGGCSCGCGGCANKEFCHPKKNNTDNAAQH